MNCKEFEKQIPDFMNRKMDFRKLKEFSEHMEKCESCKEELVIQFLVSEGVQLLEEGDTFDLQKELDERLNEAKHKVKLHYGFLRFGRVLEVIAILLMIAFLVWMVL